MAHSFRRNVATVQDSACARRYLCKSVPMQVGDCARACVGRYKAICLVCAIIPNIGHRTGGRATPPA